MLDQYKKETGKVRWWPLLSCFKVTFVRCVMGGGEGGGTRSFTNNQDSFRTITKSVLLKGHCHVNHVSIELAGGIRFGL